MKLLEREKRGREIKRGGPRGGGGFGGGGPPVCEVVNLEVQSDWREFRVSKCNFRGKLWWARQMSFDLPRLVLSGKCPLDSQVMGGKVRNRSVEQK